MFKIGKANKVHESSKISKQKKVNKEERDSIIKDLEESLNKVRDTIKSVETVCDCNCDH